MMNSGRAGLALKSFLTTLRGGKIACQRKGAPISPATFDRDPIARVRAREVRLILRC